MIQKRYQVILFCLSSCRCSNNDWFRRKAKIISCEAWQNIGSIGNVCYLNIVCKWKCYKREDFHKRRPFNHPFCVFLRWFWCNIDHNPFFIKWLSLQKNLPMCVYVHPTVIIFSTHIRSFSCNITRRGKTRHILMDEYVNNIFCLR